MSDFGTHGTQKAMDAAAHFAVNKFMAEDTAATLKALRDRLELQEAASNPGADI